MLMYSGVIGYAKAIPSDESPLLCKPMHFRRYPAPSYTCLDPAFSGFKIPELECRLRHACLVLMCTSALQVKGYLQHLSRMNLTVDQLSKTGIGKRLRSITKWGNQRKSALEPMPAAQEADPETGNLPERRSSWELATCGLSCLFPR